MKYGYLTATKRVPTPEGKDKNAIYFLCICDCGKEVVVRKSSLIKGATKSCGCMKGRMVSDKLKGKAVTHGMTNTRFYRIWHKMKRRCHNENYSEYHLYGGRGIEVCDAWHTFENFMNDMYDSYLAFEEDNGRDSATIDRIDSNGNYEKANCRWQTLQQQSRNRSDNINVIVEGVKYSTLKEVAEKYGFNYITIVERYKTGKRDKELIAPLKRKGRVGNRKGIKVEVNGVEYNSLSELQKAHPHISLVTISKRYKKGLRGEDLVMPRGQNKTDKSE